MSFSGVRDAQGDRQALGGSTTVKTAELYRRARVVWGFYPRAGPVGSPMMARMGGREPAPLGGVGAGGREGRAGADFGRARADRRSPEAHPEREVIRQEYPSVHSPCLGVGQGGEARAEVAVVPDIVKAGPPLDPSQDSILRDAEAIEGRAGCKGGPISGAGEGLNESLLRFPFHNFSPPSAGSVPTSGWLAPSPVGFSAHLHVSGSPTGMRRLSLAHTTSPSPRPLRRDVSRQW